jgi:hypothetical protein
MIFPREESSGEINKKYYKRRPGGVKLPGLFLVLFCRKSIQREFITHIFLRFSGSDTAASWSDYEVEKPDTL